MACLDRYHSVGCKLDEFDLVDAGSDDAMTDDFDILNRFALGRAVLAGRVHRYRANELNVGRALQALVDV